jgi:WD40 repeat protein
MAAHREPLMRPQSSSRIATLLFLSGLLAGCRPRAGFEPHLGIPPEGAAARLGQGGVGWLETSPDGRWLAIGNTLGVQLYQLPDFLPAWRADVLGLRGLSFSPDSDGLAGFVLPTQELPGILTWETRSGEPLRTLDVDWVGIDQPVLVWDGEAPAFVATQVFDPAREGGEDDQWSIRVIDLERRRTLDLAAQSTPAAAFALNPQGTSLLTFTREAALEWDVSTGALSRSFTLPGAVTGTAARSSDGRLLALRMVEAVAVVDLVTGEVIRSFTTRDGPGAVAFDSEGARLATTDWNGRVAVWDIRSGAGLAAWETDSDLRHLAWGPGEGFLIASSWHGPIAAWRVSTAERVGLLEGYLPPIADIAWSPDSTRLAITVQARAAGSDPARGRLLIWEPGGGEPAWLEVDSPLGAAGWSPDGREVAAWTGGGRVVFFDVQDWQVAHSAPIGDVAVTDLAWSPDGAHIALALGDREVRVIESASGDEVMNLDVLPDWQPSPEFPANPVTSVAWSPDGARLAAGMWDGPGFVFDAADGSRIAALEHRMTSFPYYNAVLDIAWMPDGRAIVGASNDGEGVLVPDSTGRPVPAPTDAVTLWDAATGQRLAALQVSPPLTAAMGVSPVQGRIAVSFSGLGVFLWEPQAGEAVLLEDLPVYSDHGDTVLRLLWSPDGHWLAGASGEGTVVVWDMRSP